MENARIGFIQSPKYVAAQPAIASDSIFYPLTLCALQIVFMFKKIVLKKYYYDILLLFNWPIFNGHLS